MRIERNEPAFPAELSPRKVSGPCRTCWRAAQGGFVVCFLFTVVALSPEICRHATHFSAFNRIKVGAPSAQAMQVLLEDRVSCDLTLKTGCQDCVFSDFWRVYQIKVDTSTDIVTQKLFKFKPQRGLFSFLSGLRLAPPASPPSGKPGGERAY